MYKNHNNVVTELLFIVSLKNLNKEIKTSFQFFTHSQTPKIYSNRYMVSLVHP